MSGDYQQFLQAKTITIPPMGIEPREPHASLFDFQRDIVKWSLRLGRSAIFADCGMGKTRMQLEWSRQIPGDVLILAPLAVAFQTVREGEALDLPVQYCRSQSECRAGINITNYEMLEHFDPDAQTLQERIGARRDSLNERVGKCAELVNRSSETWFIWCNLNSESDLLETLIYESVQVKGSDSREFKEKTLMDFVNGRLRVLISKPSIAGFGLNMQVCHNMIFVGLSDSFESYYQAVRRCWRFGQKQVVNVYIITSKTEGAVVKNIQRKEADAERMAANMVQHMSAINSENIRGLGRTLDHYFEDKTEGKNWTLYLGDCVEVMRTLEDDSLDFSVFSPPFASLYTYSASMRDMGNVKNHHEFFEHFQFVIKEIYRTLKPGRNVSFHCMNLPTSKTRDGVIGITDFRGQLIRAFQTEGFIYHSEVCIWKDPVTAMQRTKALGLLWKQLKKDSTMSRQGIADYLVTMRKPGDNPNPVSHTAENFPVDQWQKWASPVWMDIDPGDTLQYRAARENNDERHIAPLQLEVIRRAILLWSNPGDLILSPFAGIGSEGWVAIKNDRRFVGIELKRSYWNLAISNLKAAEQEKEVSLF